MSDAMTTTPGETREYAGHCIVGCGWLDNDPAEHPPYCERHVGGKAHAVTEPGWHRAQFWCYVISPFNHGMLSPADASAAEQHRDGIQLTAEIWDQVRDESDFPYREVMYNMTAAEARQLAAQLVAAADSHDGISQDHHLMRRTEKLA